MSRVSVVIPTHNHARFLPFAVESALAQSRPAFEIIVVDDGSTDETSIVLQSYGSKIRVMRQENQGVSSARNAGIEASQGDYIAFLDADDVWLPSKLELQMRRFESDPSLGLVHCGVEEIDSHGVVLGQKSDGMEGWVAGELLLFRRPVILGGGSGVVVSRKAVENAGLFDTKMSTSADWDFYYRICSRFKTGFIPEISMQYRLHGSNMHGNIVAMERDMLRGYRKAFAEADESLAKIRRQAYGNLYMVLAGSYFRFHSYGRFARNAVKSLLMTPGNAFRLIGYPARSLNRRRIQRSAKSISTLKREAAER